MVFSRLIAVVGDWLASIYKPAFSVYIIVVIPASVIAYLLNFSEQRVLAILFVPLGGLTLLYLLFYAVPVAILNRRARRKSPHPDVIVYDDHQTLEFLAGNQARLKRSLSVSAAADGIDYLDKNMLWNGPLDDITVETEINCTVELITSEIEAGTVIRVLFDEQLSRRAKTEFSFSLLFDNTSGLIRHFLGASVSSYKPQHNFTLEIAVNPARMIKFTERTFYRFDTSNAVFERDVFKSNGRHAWKIPQPQHSRKYTLAWEEPGALM